MARGFTWRAQHGAEVQLNRFTGGEQRRAVAARQQSDQVILGKGQVTQCAYTIST